MELIYSVIISRYGIKPKLIRALGADGQEVVVSGKDTADRLAKEAYSHVERQLSAARLPPGDDTYHQAWKVGLEDARVELLTPRQPAGRLS